MRRTLNQLSEGKLFRVKGFLQQGKGLRRLQELGFSEIQEGVVLRNKRGPLLVRIQERQIAIGRGLASQIEVEVLEDIRYRHLALIGQPNCGKTLLFNRLTGSTQHVGNWPGVTVEKKEGVTLIGGLSLSVVDLPGIYSFSSLSEEEEVAKAFVMEAKDTLFVNVVDATHLEANLYLTMQLALMRVPMILVINMMDEAEKEGIVLDLKRLSELLGVPVIGISALQGEDIARLKKMLEEVLDKNLVVSLRLASDEVASTLEKVAEILKTEKKEATFWMAYEFLERGNMEGSSDDSLRKIEAFRDTLVQKYKRDLFQVMTEWLISLCMGIAREVVSRRLISLQTKKRITAGLDVFFLNPVFGPVSFLLTMGGIFWATFRLGDWVGGYIEIGIGYLSHLIAHVPIPWLASVLSEGLIGGVGNVVVLLPYVVFMFLFLSFLEDSGYMARGAFLVDRFMHKLGLHGKSFVPLVLGFGCSVPAIMSTRVLDNRGDRLKTMLMIPFFSCSARMPVFILFAAAFFGKNGWLMMFALYLLGGVVGVVTAWWLNKTLVQDRSEGLIMELPVYRLPALINLWTNTWSRSKEYLIRAGSILMLFSMGLWVLSVLPWGVEAGSEASLIGYIGKSMTWVFAPLGFDWRMTVALINGFFAKEIVISTLGVLYSAGESLGKVLSHFMDLPVALAYLVFILLYTPCAATVAVIWSESRSWKWTLFSVGYSLAVAWILAFVTRHVVAFFVS